MENTGYSTFIIDGPGITGMGLNSRMVMEQHMQAGGSFIYEVTGDGFLKFPERMWPGRGLEGKKVRLDGTIVD